MTIRFSSAPAVSGLGVICGLCGIVVWYLVEGVVLDVVSRVAATSSPESEDWLLFGIGGVLAVLAGFVSAKVAGRPWGMASLGTGVGLLAGFWLPNAVVRGDVSVLLAGDETLVPTVVALPVGALLGGWLGGEPSNTRLHPSAAARR